MKHKCVDAVIIGGGVIGAATAYYIAQTGAEVALVEKDDIGGGTSGSCDGNLLLLSKSPGWHFKLAQESLNMFPFLINYLNRDVEYISNGSLMILETEEQLQLSQKHIKGQQETGLKVKLLNNEETRHIEPFIVSNIFGSCYTENNGHINPIMLTLGLAEAAQNLGAHIVLHDGVTEVICKKGKVNGVRTTSGDIYAKYVVNAAGVYANQIGKMVGIDIPVIPKRGQVLVSESLPPISENCIICGCYLKAKYQQHHDKNHHDINMTLGRGLSMEQTREGNLLIGSTREYVGYDTRTTYEGIRAIAQHAVELFPKLKDVKIIRTFAGLRPATPDGLPIIGRVESLEGLILAVGHEGDGIVLAPITGKLIAEMIAGKQPSFNIEPFAFKRFQKTG